MPLLGAAPQEAQMVWGRIELPACTTHCNDLGREGKDAVVNLQPPMQSLIYLRTQTLVESTFLRQYTVGGYTYSCTWVRITILPLRNIV